MPQRYGDWEVIESIGEGGAGWVYKAQHTTTGQLGAVKRLKNTSRHPRFVRELEAQQPLDHPNIVKVLAFDTNAEKPFIVFELVDGRPLGAIPVAELEETPVEARVKWFNQACLGVHAAHTAAQKVIHRDLKPDNILISANGVKICDFGLAFLDDEQRLTETLEQVGSRFFIAPECEEGRAELVGTATDVYSMGKVLYYLLSPGKMFPREQHRDPRYDLATIRNDPYMEVFSRWLDKMIVHDARKREDDLKKVAAQLGHAINAYSAKLPIPGVPETYRCVFCRHGTYKVVAKTGDNSTRNLGYSEGNMENEHFVFLECQFCGNAQRFKAKYDNRGWFVPKNE